MEDWKHCPQFAPLADLIRSHGSFAVIAHVHPDGDAIGSTLALGEALKQMGKKVVMMNEDGVPSNLAFMPGVENIIPTPDEPVDVEVAISVDNGALKRLGERSLEALAGVKVWANIDHHRTNELFGDVQCVLPDECATGAVLYYFFKYLGVPVTPVMRDALYVAVSTDTGSFQYQMTTLYAKHLVFLKQQVQEMDRKIAEIMDTLDTPITTITGIGPTLGAYILSEIGDISRFSSAAKLAAYAGIDPTMRQSGEYNGVRNRMSKRGSPYLRHAIWLAASSAVLHDPALKFYFQKKRDEGKPYMASVGHACRKMVSIIYAVMRDNKAYTPYIPNEISA